MLCLYAHTLPRCTRVQPKTPQPRKRNRIIKLQTDISSEGFGLGSGLIAFQAGGTKRLNLDPEVSGSLPAHDGKQTGRKGRLAAVETKPADTDPPGGTRTTRSLSILVLSLCRVVGVGARLSWCQTRPSPVRDRSPVPHPANTLRLVGGGVNKAKLTKVAAKTAFKTWKSLPCS